MTIYYFHVEKLPDAIGFSPISEDSLSEGHEIANKPIGVYTTQFEDSGIRKMVIASQSRELLESFNDGMKLCIAFHSWNVI